jgi:uncharacterized membrane protein YcaP (DUF421 family)
MMFFNSWSHLLHTLVVGILAYAALIVLLRISGKRTLSKWNAFDFVVTVAFGSTLATALLSNDTSLLQSITAFVLLILLQFVITRLSVHSSVFERWIKARPRLLLYRGELHHAVLKRERVTPSEVMAALRNAGIAVLEDVYAVVLETDGSFSVIKRLDAGTASALADVEGYQLAPAVAIRSA